MDLETIKAKLQSITSFSQYLRVSASHPLELYIGRNEKGFLTLRYNGSFTPMKVLGTNSIEIKQVRTKTGCSIMFSFDPEGDVSLFYHFCEDMINELENYSGSDGYKELVSRYTQWKKMFSGSGKALSENEVLGLLGELLFLHSYSFAKYGVTEGLNGWSGPEPTHKDFSYGREWFEIKSINAYRDAISISSLEQLDSNYPGHLYVYEFEKMSQSFDGISLNKMVSSIARELEFDADRDLFFSKLKKVGYSYNDVYDNYVFNLIGTRAYFVDGRFPRIKREDIPNGVFNVSYQILLSLISAYKEN